MRRLTMKFFISIHETSILRVRRGRTAKYEYGVRVGANVTYVMWGLLLRPANGLWRSHWEDGEDDAHAP